MWFETIHRVAEVNWTYADTRHIDVLLISERLSDVTEEVGHGPLSSWFDVSSTHWMNTIGQRS
jgi:hypothetical protein